MAFAEQEKFFNNFTGGLNTEATPLNFPENAAQAIDNVDLFVTGEVKRRLGLDFESGYTVRPETTSATNTASYALANFEWKSVNGSGDINFLVVQIGLKLYFHNLGAEPVSGTLRGTIDLSPYKTGGSAETKVLSAAFGEGIMVVANPEIDPVTIEYDEDANTFVSSRITIQIRDFEGIDEGTDNDFRPSSLSAAHGYNLRNQGWPTSATVNAAPRGSRGVQRNVDPVSYTRQKIGVYPSNADIFYAAKAASAEDAEVLGTYSPWALEHNYFGNTPAPKGHFILDAFNQNRLDNPAYTKQTNARPGAVAFYAGRIWYAGIPDHRYTGDLYFSQVLDSPEDAGKCYQTYDPTAEDLNALLATDGGEIHVADMGEVLRMRVLGADLIIVARNGVWVIQGGEASGNFQADSFSIRKVTDQGAVSREATLTAEGTLMWWGEGGIWIMVPNDVEQVWKTERITKDSIQTFYDEIPATSRAYARGYHDSFSKKIYWLYNDTDSYDAINFRFRYNRALVLDLTLGAFYTYTIEDLDANSPWVCAMSTKSPGSESLITYDVFHGEDDVVEGSDDIVQDIAFESIGNVKTKVLTFLANMDGTYSYTFSEFKDTTYHDWATWDAEINDISNEGANFTSFIQTGWNTFGDLLRDKSITHVTSFFNRTEDGFQATEVEGVVEFTNPSGCLVQTRWEFTDADTARWTEAMQAYRLRQSYVPEDAADPFAYGYTVVSSKIRMRGRGKAFSIRYLSEEGKDFQLIGFAVNVRAGAKL